MALTLLSLIELTMLRGTADHARDGETYQRIFRLVFLQRPSSTEDLDTILSWSGLPSVGDALKTGDPRYLTKKGVAAQDKTGTEFLVTCDYEIPKMETFEPNPLDRPDEIQFDGAQAQENFFVDLSTPPKDCKTSAGEPFDQLNTRFTSQFSLNISGNRSSIYPPTYALYLRPNAINNAGFTVRGVSIGEGEGRMCRIAFNRQVEGSYKFWALHWSVALAPNWDFKRPDQGYVYKIGSGDLTDFITEGKINERVIKPYPLNGSGGKQSSRAVLAAQLTFKPYPPRSFSIFGWTAEV